MFFETICRVYGLGTLHSHAPLKAGTASDVWQLETSQGSFLLRTLTGWEQGEREWNIWLHLMRKRFDLCPPILLTEEKSPCLEMDGIWYQVQRYISGSMPDPSAPGCAAEMARTVKRLARCLPDGIIHGDLGPWNMVQRDDGRIFVIDFGSVRPGDPYFDHAACFGGIINHTGGQERPAVCREFLAELQPDRTRLLEQLRQWAEEGIARWSGLNNKMAERFHHALSWAEENLHEL